MAWPALEDARLREFPRGRMLTDAAPAREEQRRCAALLKNPGRAGSVRLLYFRTVKPANTPRHRAGQWILSLWIVGAQIWYYAQFRGLFHSFVRAFLRR